MIAITVILIPFVLSFQQTYRPSTMLLLLEVETQVSCIPTNMACLRKMAHVCLWWQHFLVELKLHVFISRTRIVWQRKISFNFLSYWYIHFISITTDVLDGIVILLFEALQVSSAKRSCLFIFGMDSVFCIVCLYVPSKDESTKWLSLHQVTVGGGSPKIRKSNKLNKLWFQIALKFLPLRTIVDIFTSYCNAF